jgi:hypothetical protein
VASSVLLLAMLFVFEMLADPKSGEFRSSMRVGLIFVAFVGFIAIVFNAEFRYRKRRRPSRLPVDRRIRM